jgi:Ca-activated chloride channel homolog
VSFASPWVLMLLPLVGVVAWWWRRRRKPSVRYASLALVRDLPRGRAGRARWASILLRAGIVLFGLLAIAGPRYPDLKTRVPTDGIAIAFVCDVSGSMADRDFTWNPKEQPVSRLEIVKRAFALFVVGGTHAGEPFAGRSADAITLISFAAVPRTECPLTLNHSVLTTMVNALEPKEGGLDAGTNIGDAIAEGLIRLKSARDLRKVLIVLSDGEHNASKDGPDAALTPRQAAQLAANLSITIYSIDCGGESKATATNEERQQRDDGRVVMQQIDDLERRPIVSAVYRRYHELNGVCVACVVACFALVLWFERIWWRRLP